MTVPDISAGALTTILPSCNLCSRRAQAEKAFALFVTQNHRQRQSPGDAVTAAASGTPRSTRRKSAAPFVAASSRLRQHQRSQQQSQITSQQPARLGSDHWRLAADSTNGAAALDDRPPPGCSRYTVELRKPLGLVLEEDKRGNIYVAEVSEGGNAAKSGLVSKGDQLIATSGYVYERQTQYQSVYVRSGEKVVRMNVRGEDFDTVMAAIRSHPSQMDVKLEFQRC